MITYRFDLSDSFSLEIGVGNRNLRTERKGVWLRLRLIQNLYEETGRDCCWTVTLDKVRHLIDEGKDKEATLERCMIEIIERKGDTWRLLSNWLEERFLKLLPNIHEYWEHQC